MADLSTTKIYGDLTVSNNIKGYRIANLDDISVIYENRSITAGNGLSGGGALSNDLTISMGTPTGLSATTTDALTATSHTHSIATASAVGLTAGTSNGTGTSTSLARADHTHSIATASAVALSNTSTSTTGTSTSLARADHTHAITGFSLDTHNHTLDSLSNVTITSIASGEILKWNGTAWVNNTLSEAGIQPAGSYLTTATTFGGDVSGAYNAIVVANDSHSHTTSTLPSTMDPSNHNLIDTTKHPVSGLTTGHFLKATGATTYGFAAHGLTYSDVGALASSTTSTQSGYFGDIYLKDDTNASHYLIITDAEDLTANRTLSLDVDNADRTISLTGNLTLANNFTTSGNFALTLTSTNTTNATFPAGTITLVDLAATQTLTNKTLTSPTIAQINGSTAASGTLTLQSTTNATKGTVTITGSGVTLSHLTTAGPVITSATGVVTSEQYLDVTRGGTGVGTLTSYGVLYGNGTADIAATAAGAAGTILIGTGATTAPTWSTATLTATTLTFAGAGTINSTTTSALTLDSTTTGAVNVGTGDYAKTITIGNTKDTTTLELKAGTGTVSVTGSVTLTSTTNASKLGVIYKGSNRFIHDFNYGNNGTVTTEGKNIFVGVDAGNFTMGSTSTASYHASYNSVVGNQALQSNTTGYENSAIGNRALYANTTGYYNSAVGNQALYANTTGYENSAIGNQALYANTTGYYNSAVGYRALFSNITGYYNSAVGYQALQSNTTSYGNSAIGFRALNSNTTGYGNSAIGNRALYGNTTGYSNSAIGDAAGRYIANGSTANQTSNTSVYLGAETKAQENGCSNEIVIGYGVTGNGSNTVTIGNSSITENYFTGNVNAGKFNNLVLTSAATGFTIVGGTASKTLTVNGDATVSGTNTGNQTITSGNGMNFTGGSGNVTITLGDPSTITTSTTNSASGTTHTHALTLPSTMAPSNHNLIDTTKHPVSGLTTGHFLKATGATTYEFAAHGLTYSDVGAAASSHTHTASNITDFDTEVANNSAVAANTAKVSNVTTDISITHNATTVVVNSSDGTDGTINGATSTTAGVVTNAAQTFAGVKTFNSAPVSANGYTTGSATMVYNSTSKTIDFVFV